MNIKNMIKTIFFSLACITCAPHTMLAEGGSQQASTKNSRHTTPVPHEITITRHDKPSFWQGKTGIHKILLGFGLGVAMYMMFPSIFYMGKNSLLCFPKSDDVAKKIVQEAACEDIYRHNGLRFMLGILIGTLTLLLSSNQTVSQTILDAGKKTLNIIWNVVKALYKAIPMGTKQPAKK